MARLQRISTMFPLFIQRESYFIKSLGGFRAKSSLNGIQDDIKMLEKKKEELLHEIQELEKQKSKLHLTLGPLEESVRNLNDADIDHYLDILGASFFALDNHPYVTQYKGVWPAHFIPFVGLTIKLTGQTLENFLHEPSKS